MSGGPDPNITCLLNCRDTLIAIRKVAKRMLADGMENRCVELIASLAGETLDEVEDRL